MPDEPKQEEIKAGEGITADTLSHDAIAERLAAITGVSPSGEILERQAYYFRHNGIRRFKVGPFEFKDHICKVDAGDLDDFFAAIDGLTDVDKHQIVAVKQIQNEESIDDLRKRVARGAQDTGNINSPTTQNPAPVVKSEAAGLFGQRKPA